MQGREVMGDDDDDNDDGEVLFNKNVCDVATQDMKVCSMGSRTIGPM